jgi:hypothetical protein
VVTTPDLGNWRTALLGVTATTMEDRLWADVAKQAQQLLEAASNETWDNEKKKQAAEMPYNSIREAFKQLGVIR